MEAVLLNCPNAFVCLKQFDQTQSVNLASLVECQIYLDLKTSETVFHRFIANFVPY